MALDGAGLAETVEGLIPPEISGVVSNIIGGGSNDFAQKRMALTFLALASETDAEIGSNGEQVRRDGARAAFETWREEAQARVKSTGVANPSRDQIHENMLARIKEELQAVNSGEPLNAKGEAQVDALFQLDADKFVDAIMANAGEVNAARALHAQKLNAVAAGEKLPVYAFVGIMEQLMHADAEADPPEVRPGFGSVSLAGVDVSPQGQLEAKIDGAFDNVAQFVRTGGGAEEYLAYIAGVETGKFTGDEVDANGIGVANRMSFANVNRLEGPGTLGSGEYAQWLDDFNSPDGVGDYSLMKGGDEQPANMDTLITQALVGAGVVSFTGEGREYFNTAMANFLKEKPTGEELRTEMQRIAEECSEIKFATESDADNARDMTVDEIRQRQGGAAPAVAAAVQVAAVPDPVSATGAVAYLPGESCVGPFVCATVEATISEFESVPGFLAAMNASRQGQAVPSFSPLAQLDPQLMEPDMNMGPRVTQ